MSRMLIYQLYHEWFSIKNRNEMNLTTRRGKFTMRNVHLSNSSDPFSGVIKLYLPRVDVKIVWLDLATVKAERTRRESCSDLSYFCQFMVKTGSSMLTASWQSRAMLQRTLKVFSTAHDFMGKNNLNLKGQRQQSVYDLVVMWLHISIVSIATIEKVTNLF
jgi:hypothetical protein